MIRAPLAVVYLLSWIMQLVAILVLGWDNARSHHIIVALLVLPGTVVALGLLAQRTVRWVLAGIVSTSAVLLAYIAWWAIEIGGMHLSGALPSLADAVSMQLKIPFALFSQRLAQRDFLHGVLEAYWQVGMPALQILFLILFSELLRTSHGKP